ncbi:type II secretion system protein [Saliniradius amylolyticus]|nr:prepilin-type N-terminal cleavage/methylation domain-containing protein [Saliniradius amylolyticus]
MSAYRTSKGFTLIELLVVITIMMTVVSLVGGLSIDMLSKYRKKAEEKRLVTILSQLSESAMIRQEGMDVNLNQAQLTASFQEGQQEYYRHTFEFIRFNQQRIRINSQGLPSLTTINYQFDGSRETLNVGKALL